MAWLTLEGLAVLLRHHRADAAEGLYRLVDARLRDIVPSRSPSTSTPPTGEKLMFKTLATVDRPLHHARICQTIGESVRLTKPSLGKE